MDYQILIKKQRKILLRVNEWLNWYMYSHNIVVYTSYLQINMYNLEL